MMGGFHFGKSTSYYIFVIKFFRIKKGLTTIIIEFRIKMVIMGGFYMAHMYFAKINVNSNIYDLYKQPELLEGILNRILVEVDQKKRIKVDKEDCWIKFITLEKDMDKRFIAGRIVKIFEDEIDMYNEDKDDVDPLPTKQLARSVTFFFDLRNEHVAFVTGQRLGYGQICNYFKMLLNAYIDDVEFEIFLRTNIDEFKEKIYQFKKIIKADITLVPPNVNTRAFQKMFPQNSEEIIESRATKIRQTLSASSKSDGINPKSALIERVIDGVSNGYGNMVVSGKGANGDDYSITSQADAPHKRNIHNNIKQSIPGIIEAGRAYIVELLSKKQG